MSNSEYTEVLIRPSDNRVAYWIHADGEHSVKITPFLEYMPNHVLPVEPIVISRHDWDLYVGAAKLCGFEAVAHYARAQENKAKWEDEKNIFRVINARRPGKSLLKRMGIDYGYSLELNQERIKQHVTGTWLANDDIVDATAFAVLSRKINARDM